MEDSRSRFLRGRRVLRKTTDDVLRLIMKGAYPMNQIYDEAARVAADTYRVVKPADQRVYEYLKGVHAPLLAPGRGVIEVSLISDSRPFGILLQDLPLMETFGNNKPPTRTQIDSFTLTVQHETGLSPSFVNSSPLSKWLKTPAFRIIYLDNEPTATKFKIMPEPDDDTKVRLCWTDQSISLKPFTQDVRYKDVLRAARNIAAHDQKPKTVKHPHHQLEYLLQNSPMQIKCYISFMAICLGLAVRSALGDPLPRLPSYAPVPHDPTDYYPNGIVLVGFHSTPVMGEIREPKTSFPSSPEVVVLPKGHSPYTLPDGRGGEWLASRTPTGAIHTHKYFPGGLPPGTRVET